MNRRYGFLVFMVIIICSGVNLYAFETGQASWYGGKFQGRKTANGEIFDTNKLTAAHKTLPFGSLVKVTNLKNDRSVTVRINDRGPFVEGRVIDLSRAAADEIEMTANGVAIVKLEIISLPEGHSEEGLIKSVNVSPVGIPDSYTVQVASFRAPDNASKCLLKLKNSGLNAVLESSGSGMIRVIVPGIQSDDIEHIKSQLAQLGFSKPLVRHN